MFTLIIIAFLIIFFSAILNSIEAAFLSAPLSKVKALADGGKFGAKTLLSLKEKVYQPIIVLVILINIVGIGGSILVGNYAAKIMESTWLGIFSGFLIFFIILFAEIFPKSFGVRYALPLALIFSPILDFFIKIFSPLIFLISKFIPLKKIAAYLPLTTSEEEIRLLTITGAKTGAIEEDEAKMIQSAFRLNDITAKDLMTPRPLIFWLDGNKTLGEKKEKIKKSFHSRILICDGELDKIFGVSKRNDLLQALVDGKENMPLKEFAQWVLSVPDTRAADDLLRDFQKTHSHFAVVIDEYGEVEGVVTREDILQELVGELISEKDIAPELIKRVTKNEILVHGQTKLSYLNHFFNTTLKGAQTLNGYLLKRFERFPQKGEVLETDSLKLIIEEASDRAIEKVRIIKMSI